MEDFYLTETELRMADILWQAAPLPSAELVRRCEAACGWKKSTTYTILKHLEEKGVCKNQNGTVQVLLTRQQYETQRSRSFVGRAFGGSLPRFLAAFSGGRPLSDGEVEELRRFIDEYKEE